MAKPSLGLLYAATVTSFVTVSPLCPCPTIKNLNLTLTIIAWQRSSGAGGTVGSCGTDVASCSIDGCRCGCVALTVVAYVTRSCGDREHEELNGHKGQHKKEKGKTTESLLFNK